MVGVSFCDHLARRSIFPVYDILYGFTAHSVGGGFLFDRIWLRRVRTSFDASSQKIGQCELRHLSAAGIDSVLGVLAGAGEKVCAGFAISVLDDRIIMRGTAGGFRCGHPFFC